MTRAVAPAVTARRQVLVWVWAALAVGALAVAVWLAGLHVHADVSAAYGGGASGDGPAECGSAYSVLVQGDAFRGGLRPANQADIDAQCLVKARQAVGASGLAVLAAGIASLAGVRAARRSTAT